MTTERLVERARAGDVDAYGRLVALTECAVRAAVLRVLDDRTLVEDAVQETYLKAFRSLSSLHQPGAFDAWIRRVAKNSALNLVRRRRPVFVDPVNLVAPARAEKSGTGRTARALDRALVALPPEERRLLTRYYRGGWSTKRLGRDAGISANAVRKRLQRLRDRLRKDITMTLERAAGNESLPDRIVALLSRPVLVDLPENPVGAVWDLIREARRENEEIELPEILRIADVAALSRLEPDGCLPERVHRIDDHTILRFDQTVPILLAAKGRPSGTSLLAAGKVYRDHPDDRSHLTAFHQAELLRIDRGLSSWTAMDWIAGILEAVLPGRALRVETTTYPPYAADGFEVAVRHAGEWVEIGGFARFDDHIVSALGHEPSSVCAVGAGLGLERIACLRYDIDDIRRVGAGRVDRDAE